MRSDALLVARPPTGFPESLEKTEAVAAMTSSSSASPAALPRWSHDDDGSVTVVQSTQEYTRNIFQMKPRNARWVRGLAEDEDLNFPTAGAFRRRTNLKGWEELDDTPDAMGMTAAGPAFFELHQRLFYQNILAILYWCLLLARVMKGLHRSYHLDYPLTPRDLGMYGRRFGENGVSYLMRVGIPLATPHAVGSAYTLGLSYCMGAATHNFLALCGVGLSLLSLLALCTQYSILLTSCEMSNVSHRWECDTYFVSHHVCSAFRAICPLLAMWCVAPLFDHIRGGGYRWRGVLAIPCLSALACLAYSLYLEKPSHSLLDVAHGALLSTLPFLVYFCWKRTEAASVGTAAEGRPKAEGKKED